MIEVKETGLLVEGTRSYPEALGALNEFGRLVVLRIRNVVVEELDSLSTAMGVGLPENELTDYVRPNRLGSFDPQLISLGVRIDRIGKSGWGLYFLLWWSKGQANLYVSIWLRDGNIAESILSAFKKSPPRTPLGFDAGHEVYLSRVLVPNNAEEQLPLVLRELIRTFSELWTKAGGLSKFPKS